MIPDITYIGIKITEGDMMNPNKDKKGSEVPQTYNPLEHIMDIGEASILWGLQPSTIKDICRLRLEKEGMAIKKGKTWILNKNQPNPGQPQHPNNWRSKVKSNEND